MVPFASSRRLSRRWIAVAVTVACAAMALPVTTALAATRAPGQATRALSAAARCGIAHPALPGGAFVWSSSIGDGFVGGAGSKLRSPTSATTRARSRAFPAWQRWAVTAASSVPVCQAHPMAR
jgi:hypothetical protein